MSGEDPPSWKGAGTPAALPALDEFLEMGVLTLDGDLVIRGWNAWLGATSGRDADAVIGEPLFSVFPELADSDVETVLRRALAGGTTVWSQQFHRYFLPLPPPPGHEALDRMQQTARIVPLVRDGHIEGVLALVHDVTERVVREQELRDALRRVEIASQAKSDFLASMSHELRTPLTAIVGYMDLLQGGMVGEIEPLQKTYLGRVKTAARHLISIIEEILTFSRIEAGKETVAAEQFDAAEFVRDVEVLFEPEAQLKRLELSVGVPDVPVPVRTDPTKLRQILINLLGNALKFTDAGSVSVTLKSTPDEIVIRVSDTGPGIPAADVGKVFDPFTQLDQSRTRVKGGTGLGLPVSRRLAELLGGELTLENGFHPGCCFVVRLPRFIGDADTAPEQERPLRLHSRSAQGTS